MKGRARREVRLQELVGDGCRGGGGSRERCSQGPLSCRPAAIRAKEAQRMKGRGRREVRLQEGRKGNGCFRVGQLLSS